MGPFSSSRGFKGPHSLTNRRFAAQARVRSCSTLMVVALGGLAGPFGFVGAAAAQAPDPTPLFESTSALPSSFMDDLQTVSAGTQAAQGVVRHLTARVIPELPEVRIAISEAYTATSAAVGVALLSGVGFRATEPSPWVRRGRWSWPIPRASLAAGFGDRRRDDSTTMERHTGWSLQATVSTEVATVARGVVLFAEQVDGLGFTVIVAHAQDLHTVYAGMLSISVRQWHPVEEGDVLGLGAAEAASGRREIYFEVREAGVPVDPDSWLR